MAPTRTKPPPHECMAPTPTTQGTPQPQHAQPAPPPPPQRPIPLTRGSLCRYRIFSLFQTETTLCFSKNRITLTEAYCPYLFSGFKVQLLFCSYFVNQQKGDNGWRMGEPYFRSNTTFPPMTEQTMPKPKILMVLNLFKILYIYLCLSISVSKSCHIVINIFFDCLHPAWCCF